MAVPKKYIDEYNEFEDIGWSQTHPIKQSQSPTYKHRRQQHPKYRFHNSDQVRTRSNNNYSPNYYYIPFAGRGVNQNEPGTLSAMDLINDPNFLKKPPILHISHQNICFFKIKNQTRNYLVKLNDKHLRIVTSERIRDVNHFDLNTIPIEYPAIAIEEYKLAKAVSLNEFRPLNFNLNRMKSPMSCFIMKEIAQKYEHQYKQQLNSDFMSSCSSLKRICHVIMSNIKPGRYKVHDPLNILIWSENSFQSIDPKSWNKNIIQLHDITTDEQWEPDTFSDNPNSLYGCLFEHMLTKSDTMNKYKYMEMSDESNAFVFSKMKLTSNNLNDSISLLLKSEQDCRVGKNKLAEIKLSKMYHFPNYRGAVVLDKYENIRIPFWKFMSYWLQCFLGHKDDMIIGFHKNGKITHILQRSIKTILNQNEGLEKVVAFVKYALFKVLKWMKKCIENHSGVAPLVLKTQLAKDQKGNEYNQFIVKQFGGEYVLKLELTKLLEYGQKTHNIYLDTVQDKFHIQQVNFCYVNNIISALERKYFPKKNDSEKKKKKGKQWKMDQNIDVSLSEIYNGSKWNSAECNISKKDKKHDENLKLKM